jgi:hypothetical protein
VHAVDTWGGVIVLLPAEEGSDVAAAHEREEGGWPAGELVAASTRIDTGRETGEPTQRRAPNKVNARAKHSALLSPSRTHTHGSSVGHLSQ